jgi:hypothetical protein
VLSSITSRDGGAGRASTRGGASRAHNRTAFAPEFGDPLLTRLTVARAYRRWGYELPEQLAIGEPTNIARDYWWTINVVMDLDDEQRPVIEVFAGTRFSNAQHYRVNADGTVEGIASETEWITYPPDATPDDELEPRNVWVPKTRSAVRSAR